MGGRVGAALALRHPERVRAARARGASPGLDDAAERAARVAADEALAEPIERDGLEAFVERWKALPLFATQRAARRGGARRARAERLRNRAHGLAASLRGMGAGAQAPLRDALAARARCRCCSSRAREDAKFAAHRRAISRARLPDARVAVVPRRGPRRAPRAARTRSRRIVARVPRRVDADRLKATAMPIGDACDDARLEDRARATRTSSTSERRGHRARSRSTARRCATPSARRRVVELIDAFTRARDDPTVGVVILTGDGRPRPSARGGDQRVRGDGGYVGDDGVPRLNVLDLQRMIRTLPKPVIAMVAGYAIGGGHVLHVVCDLTIAADNARFGQTGPRVGSFDGGFGASLPGAHRRPEEGARDLVPLPPVRRAARRSHGARQHGRAARPSSRRRASQWCREILGHSPLALRCLKAAFNADCDGQAGMQELAGNATLLFYMTEEAQEGRDAFLEKRAARLRAVPAAAVTRRRPSASGEAALARLAGCWPRARARCRRRSCRSLVGTRGRGRARRARDRGVALRRAGGGAAAPDRHQLRQRRASTSSAAPTPPSGSGRRAAAQAGLLTPARCGAAIVAGASLAAAVSGSYLVARRRLADRCDRRCSRSLAALAYTGGPWPLGYHGLGDLFVFVFFGVVAVCGTVYAADAAASRRSRRSPASLPVGVPRDRDPRRQQPARHRRRIARAGKRTLAVRLGRRAATRRVRGACSRRLRARRRAGCRRCGSAAALAAAR